MAVTNETIERIVYEGVDRITAASRSAEGSVKSLRQSLDAVKNVLGALGVTVGAGALVALYTDAVRTTAALDDMAESTGASVEGLSAIQRVAKVGGHDFEGLTGQLGRMVKGLREGTEEGGKAAHAFAFLDVKTREADGSFRDTSQILLDLAQRLAKYKDGGDKVALVQDALGKGAERYLPLLKEMAEGTDLLATRTAKQAEEAERLEKNINRLKLAVSETGTAIALGITPAMVRFTDQMLEANRAGGLWLATMRAAASLAGTAGGLGPLGLLGKLAGAGIDAATRTTPGRGSQADVRRIDNAQAETLIYRPPPDEGVERRDRDFVARQLQEGLEEEQRIQTEAFHWTAFYADKKREAEKAQLDARMQAMIEFYDREQELAVERGQAQIDADGQSHSQRLEALRLLLDEEVALETNAYELRMMQLQAFTDEELAAYGGRYALIEGMNAQHQARLLDIESRKHQAQRSMEVGTLQLGAALLQNFAGKSKAAALAVIAISKGLHIAQTIQATSAAVMRAYADLGPIAGSAAAAWIQTLGGIQVGLIGATGLVEAANIGGGASAQPTFPVNSITGLPAAAPVTEAPQRPSVPTIIINLPPERTRYTREEVRELLELIQEESRDGSKVIVG